MPVFLSKIIEITISILMKYVISKVSYFLEIAQKKFKRNKDQKEKLKKYEESLKNKKELSERVKDAEDVLNSGSN